MTDSKIHDIRTDDGKLICKAEYHPDGTITLNGKNGKIDYQEFNRQVFLPKNKKTK